MFFLTPFLGHVFKKKPTFFPLSLPDWLGGHMKRACPEAFREGLEWVRLPKEIDFLFPRNMIKAYHHDLIK